MNDSITTFEGRITCEVVKTFIERLIGRGFTLLHNGDDPDTCDIHPTPTSLHYKLQSPVDLDNIDLNTETYYLAVLEENVYMCENHYHIVKLVSPN